jgi:cytochrome c-type biogenesis protein CcmH
VRERELNRSLEQLEIQLKREPQDAETMVLFARTLAELNRYPAAAIAFAKVAAALPNEPTLQIEWASAEYMANDQKWTPVAIAALTRGIELAPRDPEALWLAGKERFENQDYVRAVRYWESLENVVPPGSENARELKASLAQARTLRDGRSESVTEPSTTTAAVDSRVKPSAAASPSKVIAGIVSLDARLKSRAAPNDSVYIFARDAAETHDALPLAILRHRVAELPLTFELSDNNTMSAQAKLSNAPKVIVIARISKSGDSRPQLGDLEGTSLPIPPGTERVAIVINRAR